MYTTFFNQKRYFLILFFIGAIVCNAQQSGEKQIVKSGVEYFGSSDYKNAYKTFSLISEEYKQKNSEVIYYQVYCLVRLGALHRADSIVQFYKNYVIKTPHKEKLFSEIKSFLATGLNQYDRYVDQSDKATDSKFFDEAKTFINQAIEIDSFFIDGYNRRAFIYINLEMYDACIKDCDKVLSIDSENAIVFYYKASALLYLKDYVASGVLYSKYIAIQPTAKAYYQRACTYYYLGEYKKAMNGVNDAIQKDETYNYPYYLRGRLYQINQEHALALKDFERASFLGLTEIDLYVLKGECLFFLDKYASALIEIDKSLAIKENAIAYYYKGRCIVSMGDFYDDQIHINAMKFYDKAIAIDSTNPEFFYLRANSKKMCDRDSEAIRDLEKAIKLNDLEFNYYDEQNTCHYLKGSLFRIRKRDLYIGINAYKRDIKLNDKPNSQSYFNMSKCYNLIWSFTKDKAYLDTTFQILNTYLEHNPKNAEAYFERGMLWYSSAGNYNYEKAIDDLTRSLQYDSANYIAYVNLGWAYMHTDKPKKAYDIFVIMKRRYPKNSNTIDSDIAEAKRRMQKDILKENN